MSVDKAFREMIRAEVELQLRPLHEALGRLEREASGFAALAHQLSPLGMLLGAAPERKAPGFRTRTRASNGSNERPCALIGCKSKARSKGYCAAHYQKYRNLAATRRLPADWVEHAQPNSVQNVVLPRGRAARPPAGPQA